MEIICYTENERLCISTYQTMRNTWRGIGSYQCRVNAEWLNLACFTSPEYDEHCLVRMVTIHETMMSVAENRWIVDGDYLRDATEMQPTVTLSIQPRTPDK